MPCRSSFLTTRRFQLSKGDAIERQSKISATLALPVVFAVAGLIAVPTWDKVDPMWDGMPFFYWYQLFWLLGGGVITGIVFFASDMLAGNCATRRDDTTTADPNSAAEPAMEAAPPLIAEFHFEAFEGEADL